MNYFEVARTDIFAMTCDTDFGSVLHWLKLLQCLVMIIFLAVSCYDIFAVLCYINFAVPCNDFVCSALQLWYFCSVLQKMMNIFSSVLLWYDIFAMIFLLYCAISILQCLVMILFAVSGNYDISAVSCRRWWIFLAVSCYDIFAVTFNTDFGSALHW